MHYLFCAHISRVRTSCCDHNRFSFVFDEKCFSASSFSSSSDFFLLSPIREPHFLCRPTVHRIGNWPCHQQQQRQPLRNDQSFIFCFICRFVSCLCSIRLWMGCWWCWKSRYVLICGAGQTLLCAISLSHTHCKCSNCGMKQSNCYRILFRSSSPFGKCIFNELAWCCCFDVAAAAAIASISISKYWPTDCCW